MRLMLMECFRIYILWIKRIERERLRQRELTLFGICVTHRYNACSDGYLICHMTACVCVHVVYCIDFDTYRCEHVCHAAEYFHHPQTTPHHTTPHSSRDVCCVKRSALFDQKHRSWWYQFSDMHRVLCTPSQTKHFMNDHTRILLHHLHQFWHFGDYKIAMQKPFTLRFWITQLKLNENSCTVVVLMVFVFIGREKVS